LFLKRLIFAVNKTRASASNRSI